MSFPKWHSCIVPSPLLSLSAWLITILMCAKLAKNILTYWTIQKFSCKKAQEKGIHHIHTNRFIQNVNIKNAFKCVSSWTTIQNIVREEMLLFVICLHQLLKVLHHKVLYFSMNACMREIYNPHSFICTISFFVFYSINSLLFLWILAPIVILFYFYRFDNNVLFIVLLWFILNIE